MVVINQELITAQSNLNSYLIKNPHMQPYQDRIDKKLEDVWGFVEPGEKLSLDFSDEPAETIVKKSIKKPITNKIKRKKVVK